MIMDNYEPEWRFCAVGNIVRQHTDENGILRYGSKAYCGGRRVYLDRWWDEKDGTIMVIGLNRYKRWALNAVPVEQIEHVRLRRVFKPTVLRIMHELQLCDGWEWWGDKPADRKEIKEFIRQWNAMRSESTDKDKGGNQQ